MAKRKSVFCECLEAAANGVHNQSLGLCSRWATERQIMQDGRPYSLDDYPYIIGILNSRAKKNWVMKGTQVGASEKGKIGRKRQISTTQQAEAVD